MVKVVVLDSGPLGLLVNPNPTPTAAACRQWASAVQKAGHRLVIPEIIDYELRRELCLVGATLSLGLLDALPFQFDYLPLNTPTLHRAAALWARARQTGQPTAHAKNIDVDMILIAQAESLADPNAVIATTNLRHIHTFFPAELWPNVLP